MVPGSFWRISPILSTGMKPGKGRREREREGEGKKREKERHPACIDNNTPDGALNFDRNSEENRDFFATVHVFK